MLRYVFIVLVFLFCVGCGSAQVVNSGPKADNSSIKKEEGPTTTWTITIDDGKCSETSNKDRK